MDALLNFRCPGAHRSAQRAPRNAQERPKTPMSALEKTQQRIGAQERTSDLLVLVNEWQYVWLHLGEVAQFLLDC